MASRRLARSSPTPRCGYNWRTYPERLLAAGITWKIYQDKGVGLDAAGAWGWADARPLYRQLRLTIRSSTFCNIKMPHRVRRCSRRSQSGTQIYNSATGTYNNGTLFDQLRSDVMNNTLPQVSWIPAPEAYCEHPNYPANYGAWYVSNVLSALTSNPAVFASTVFIICYDENDGFFDHVVPPTPPMNAGARQVDGIHRQRDLSGHHERELSSRPVRAGCPRPGARHLAVEQGRWVCSEVFDHTSTIRFIEKRFGVTEPNITPWRRAVCGDMTSALDFSKPIAKTSPISSTVGYAPPASDISGNVRKPDFPVVLPGTNALPAQEPGYKGLRALPYELQADGQVNPANGTIGLTFTNTGDVGAWFHVRTANNSRGGRL